MNEVSRGMSPKHRHIDYKRRNPPTGDHPPPTGDHPPPTGDWRTPMAQDSAPCTVRAPVPLQVGDGKSDPGRPGVYVMDVTLPKPQTVNEISFKNFYTAFLTVRIQQRKNSKNKRWRTCVRDLCLMPSPHTEDGSQDFVSLHAQQMLCATDHVVTIRLILRQPSPAWATFTVEDLQINPSGQQSLQKGFSWWLNHLPPKEQLRSLKKGLPDPNRVSSELQQMWVLTEMMRSNHSSASVGRFDVDGCYDINLLSYT